MAKKPIEIFKNDTQFQECCKDWKHKLFLDDWFIRFELTDEEIKYDDDLILDGLCEFNFNNKEAKIKIFNGQHENPDDYVVKHVGELTVIHELLHIRLEYISDADILGSENDSLGKYIKHQAVESMAKSLIMAKYNLDYNYFIRE